MLHVDISNPTDPRGTRFIYHRPNGLLGAIAYALTDSWEVRSTWPRTALVVRDPATGRAVARWE